MSIGFLGLIIMFFLAALMFLIAIFQFNEKGMLFNNAYIYASKSERERMNKTPHYRQSAIVFSMIGIIFITLGIELFLGLTTLLYLVLAECVGVVIYAISSSITISRKERIES